MLEPRRLLTFREVARRRSFSRAADALALTQPAVSQQVRALETQAGARLVERRPGGGFSLTAAGDLLLTHAEALADRLQLAERQLAEAVAGERGRLRVGAFPSVLAGAVPGAIERVRAEHEGFEATIVQGSTVELVARVRDGRLHCGLCFQDAAEPRREHAGVDRRDLFDEAMVAVLGPRHRLAGRTRIRLRDLADDAWTAATSDGLIRRACVAAGFEPRLVYLTADPLAIRALVAADLAVTLTPRLLAPHLHGVSTAAIAGTPVRRTVYAVTPPGTPHPLLGRFLDALRP
jgi:DNA-binding transcriptional LysR family regulator